MKIRSATGIYSRPLSKEGYENFDKIFRKAAKTKKVEEKKKANEGARWTGNS